MAVTDIFKKIPAYNYVVGQKSNSQSAGFPVRIMIDKDFKKTILTGITILSTGIAIAGIAIGYSKRSERKRRRSK
jgi:hypothetical protein